MPNNPAMNPDSAPTATEPAGNSERNEAQAGGSPVAARDAAYWTGILRDSATTPAQLYSAATETRGNAATRDLSHELLYQAALRGDGEAQRAYARLYDPTISEATGWEARKKAATALDFYTRLRANGDQAATQDVRRVCAFLEPETVANADNRTAFDDYCSQ